MYWQVIGIKKGWVNMKETILSLMIVIPVFVVGWAIGYDGRQDLEHRIDRIIKQQDILLSDIRFYQCTISQMNKNPYFDYFDGVCREDVR